MARIIAALPLLAAVVATAVLTACAPPPIPPPPVEQPDATPRDLVEGCCIVSETYPDWLIAVAEANPGLMMRIGAASLRPGRMLRQDASREIVLDALQPLDLVLFHSANRMSGHLIPGHFTHAAIHIGTEAQLRTAGLWELPAVVPHHDRIRAGGRFLEAVERGVWLAPTDVVLDTDGVAILRPEWGHGVRARALSCGMDSIGTPFDRRFDSADPSALFCSELVALMFPEADLPRQSAYGREVIVIDAIAAAALAQEIPFDLVGYLETTPGGGARALSARDLAWRLRLEWSRPRASARLTRHDGLG